MSFYTTIPHPNNNLKNQTAQMDVNDEYYKALFETPQYLPIHKIFQVLCFVLFLGPIKIVVSFVSFIIWMIAIRVLPFFESLFVTTVKYKAFSHKLLQKLMRVFLFALGFVRIDVSGNIVNGTRIIVSNHISFVDYIIFFYAFPITLVKKADQPGWETFLTGTVFDIFYLKPRKSLSPSEQLANLASDPSFLPILLFPEDKPTNGNAILAFRSAAFYTEYGVQLATIKYNIGLTPPGFNSIISQDGFSFGLLMRILCTPFISCHITVLEDSHKEQEEQPDKPEPSAIALNSQLRIANELGVLAISRSVNQKRKKQ